MHYKVALSTLALATLVAAAPIPEDGSISFGSLPTIVTGSDTASTDYDGYSVDSGKFHADYDHSPANGDTTSNGNKPCPPGSPGSSPFGTGNLGNQPLAASGLSSMSASPLDEHLAAASADPQESDMPLVDSPEMAEAMADLIAASRLQQPASDVQEASADLQKGSGELQSSSEQDGSVVTPAEAAVDEETGRDEQIAVGDSQPTNVQTLVSDAQLPQGGKAVDSSANDLVSSTEQQQSPSGLSSISTDPATVQPNAVGVSDKDGLVVDDKQVAGDSKSTDLQALDSDGLLGQDETAVGSSANSLASSTVQPVSSDLSSVGVESTVQPDATELLDTDDLIDDDKQPRPDVAASLPSAEVGQQDAVETLDKDLLGDNSDGQSSSSSKPLVESQDLDMTSLLSGFMSGESRPFSRIQAAQLQDLSNLSGKDALSRLVDSYIQTQKDSQGPSSSSCSLGTSKDVVV